MDYYRNSWLVHDIEEKFKEKREKMELLKWIESDNIYHKVLIITLQSEINELQMQLT